MKRSFIVSWVVIFSSQVSIAQAPFRSNDNTGSGNGLYFDGVNDFVDCGSIGSSATGTTEAWIMPSGNYGGVQSVMAGDDVGGANVNDRHAIFVQHMGICPSGDWLTVIGNGVSFQNVCSGQPYNSTNFPPNIWTHVAITYDGSTIKFYKDGVLISSVAQTVSAIGNAQPYSIGKIGAVTSGNIGHFSGKIDEARIWNTARTQDQIKNDMCKQLTGNESGLVGYWNMNEGTGVTVTDLTSSGNNGTLQQ